MERPEVIAYSLIYIKSGGSVEGLVHELSEREGGMFSRVERALRRGMGLADALRRASSLERDEVMRELYSTLAAFASNELADIEGRLSELLDLSLAREREEIGRKVRIFTSLSSALMLVALSFAIIGALSALIASLPLGPFGSMFAIAGPAAAISLPIGMALMLLLALLGWWFAG